MPDGDSVDWDGLVQERLDEKSRRERSAERAAEPPPGPEAAERVAERLRSAGLAGVPDADRAAETPPLPPGADGGFPPRQHHRHHQHHRRHLSLHRLRRAVFLALLAALLVGGFVLTFWPEIRAAFFERETPVLPLVPAGEPKALEPSGPEKAPAPEPSPAPAAAPTQDQPAVRTERTDPDKEHPRPELPERLPPEGPGSRPPAAAPTAPSAPDTRAPAPPLPEPPEPPRPPAPPPAPRTPWDDGGGADGRRWPDTVG